MPAVSERFKTYREFASATLEDIYGDRLEKAYKVTANHLETGVWINETQNGGAMKFRWQALPWDAQLSPVNDIVSGDFDGDGNIELIFAQNHFTNWIETGLWRGNPGCHLEWSGSEFKVISHRTSGILLPNDTKAILTIDMDNDGLSDIISAENNQGLRMFKNATK